MTRHFCTYFDRHYLPRGLALHRSLRAQGVAFRLWVLCLDRACHEALSRLALAEVRLIALDEFELGDAPLRAAKANRSPLEYYFTCTASLPLYVFRQDPSVDLVTYVDADLYFFAPPDALYDELGTGSIGIIDHRIAKHLPPLGQYGRFNVGWVMFRRDENGLACLAWWRERCLEWCYDRVEDGRFAEQKYLDDWPTRFRGVVVLEHRGANVAPWNLADHPIRRENGALRVGDAPLLFFHFHGLRRIAGRMYDANLATYSVRPDETVRRHVIAPYLGALEEAARVVAPYLERPADLRSAQRRARHGSMARRAALRVRRWLQLLTWLVEGRLLLAPRRPRGGAETDSARRPP